jgi:hypothetical protein
MMHFIKTLPILFVLGIITLIVSCEDDKTTSPQDQAPIIPPQTSMIINFDEFPDTTSVGGLENPVIAKRNWAWAAGNVKYWNSVLTVTLAVPVAAFVEAFNHEPVKQSDGGWLWQYNVEVDEVLFTAKLFGKTVNEGVEWKMLLTKEGEYTDFEWFTGFSNLTATEGNWTLNKDPNSPSAFLSIEWNRITQEETADVKYTLLSPFLPQNESYIFYGKTNEVPLNRFYQIFKAESNNLIDIKWSYESYFGRVKDSIYFEDTNWHCWDERLDDADCPE